MIKEFRINNPKRSDQKILQQVNISDSLQLDYSKSEWISIDTEFLSFNPVLDTLCTIQIASEDPNDANLQRVEILHVYNSKADSKLVNLLTDKNIEKIFHVFQADMPRVENFIGQRIGGKIFDTQIAARIALTNLESHSMETLVKYLVDPTFQENKKVTSSEWDRKPEEWEEDQFKYAAEDVLYLNSLRKALLNVAERRNKLEILEEVMLTLPSIAQVIKMGYNPNLFGF